MSLEFKILNEDGRARTGLLSVNGKRLETPSFVYAATYGVVNLVPSSEFPRLGIKAVMVNTFQLHRTYLNDIREQGGISKYMKLDGEVTMSDSAGFQIMSYGDSRVDGTGKIAFPDRPAQNKPGARMVFVDDEGATFKLKHNERNETIRITPQVSMELQAALGTDIIFAFDQCHTKKSHSDTMQIMERSHLWEGLSLKHRDPKQAIYGIVHGGQYKDLRVKSAEFVNQHEFDGVSVGGYLGESKDEKRQIIDFALSALDKNRPVHLLGLGRIDDLFDGVEQGVDTFDCVEITKLGRHGWAFVSPKEQGNHPRLKYILDIKASQHEHDERPIDRSCCCRTCMTKMRSDLVKMRIEDVFAFRQALTMHNVYFASKLMSEMRTAIKEGRFKELRQEWI